jgi:hypothetical protein
MKRLFISPWGDLTSFGMGLVVVGLICALVLGINAVEERSCNNYEEVTGRDSKWVFMDACYVQRDDGTWIRYDKAYKE